MAASSGAEKTEDATPKKRKDARKKGTVAKSPEVVMWSQVLVGSLLLRVTIRNGESILRDLFARLADAAANPELGTAMALFGHGMKSALLLLAPLLFGMMLVALIGDLSQTKGNFAASVVKPKTERISILKGAKRLFSPQGAWQAVKVLIKCSVLIAVGWGPLSTMTESLIGATRPPLSEVVGVVGSTSLVLGRNVALAGLVLAGADYAMMRRKVNKDLKMTKQEVKDEYKQAEGDAQVKGQIRQRQREMSQNRMMADVADATVVIVNPTHVAVALKYDPVSGAPRVVAKGQNDVAMRIRAEAEKHSVPMVRDIPLARSIHAGCDVGQEIPPDLYETVARLLAFVFSLDRRLAALRGVIPSPTAVSY